MELRLRRAHVRPLIHEPRRNADRQIPWQVHAVEIECLAGFVAGQLAGERGELVARLGQLLLQRRQGRAALRKLRFLAQHVGLRCATQGEALPHEVQFLALVLDDVLVAAIWPRSDASCTAATTTFEVSVRYVASSWNR